MSPFLFRHRRLVRNLFALVLAATLSRCGGGAPVLLLMLNQVDDKTMHLRIVVAQGARSGTLEFGKNLSNQFVASSVMMMPSQLPTPSTLDLAVDLPEGTSGTVSVSVTLDSVSGPGTQPMQSGFGCASADVEPGQLVAVPITVVQGQGGC